MACKENMRIGCLNALLCPCGPKIQKIFVEELFQPSDALECHNNQ